MKEKSELCSECGRYSGPRVNLAVDVIPYDTETGQVLVGRKETTPEGRWIFIGGFTDPEKDQRPSATAARELKEESSLIVDPSEFNDFGFFNIPDPRLEGSKDAIWSNVFILLTDPKFKLDVLYGQTPVAGDDLVEVEWADLKTLDQTIMPYHLEICKHLQEVLV